MSVWRLPSRILILPPEQPIRISLMSSIHSPSSKVEFSFCLWILLWSCFCLFCKYKNLSKKFRVFFPHGSFQIRNLLKDLTFTVPFEVRGVQLSSWSCFYLLVWEFCVQWCKQE